MGVRAPAFFLSEFFGGRARWRKWALGACCLLAAVSLDAQRRHGPSPLDTLGDAPSQERGFEILQKYRSLGVAGDYRLGFQLRVMPRREATRSLPGVLMGTQGEQGPVTRVDVVLTPSDVTETGELVPARLRRLLLQNGLFAKAWELEKAGEGEPQPKLIPSDQYFEPIANSDFTVFDLLMPFNYWQRFEYEGRTTFRGRPTHVFWLYPPEEDELMRQRVSGVRIFIDEEFFALIQVEIYAPEEEHVKTLSIVDFKKVEGQWILGQVDVRDEQTRDKTRFDVVDAYLDVEVPDWVFAPEGLLRPVYGTEVGLTEGAAEAVEGSDREEDAALVQ